MAFGAIVLKKSILVSAVLLHAVTYAWIHLSSNIFVSTLRTQHDNLQSFQGKVKNPP